MMLRRYILLLLGLVISWSTIEAQDAEAYYNKAIKKAQAGKLDAAIRLFDKCIEQDDQMSMAYYNRAIAKMLSDRDAEAVEDFDRFIEMNPRYQKAYLNRGNAKKYLTDYEGSLEDYSKAIDIDVTYTDAYFNRGLLYQLLSKYDLACEDFNKALEMGMEDAQHKVDQCNDSTGRDYNIILRLTEFASDSTYGLTPDHPVKVGKGPDGGPANQRAYLNLLRDAQGNAVSYYRRGSCCPYESPNGFLGMAMVDKYVVTHKDEKGKKQETVIYISLYDYEAPKIPMGFKAVGLE